MLDDALERGASLHRTRKPEVITEVERVFRNADAKHLGIEGQIFALAKVLFGRAREVDDYI